MPELAFDMTARNHEHRRLEFRGENKNNYYEGELRALSARDVDMKIEKTVVDEYSIFRLESNSALSFRRSWAHIRSDKTNVTVIWFVRRGEIEISYPGARHRVRAGECAITRSSRPFYMECRTDESRSLDLMHVVVPSHKLYTLMSDNVEIGRPFPASHGELRIAGRIFMDIFEEGDLIEDETLNELAETTLRAISKAMTERSGGHSPRCSIADRRISDITRYIRQNFGNPDLNARMVAESCGISLRYLCHVLKKNDLSFSQLVWETRLGAAQGWLAEERMQYHSICEIAYLAGFKSSAHFSRVFKLRYGMAPRDFRSSHLERQAA